MLTMLLNHADIARRDLSSLRFINTGGAPMPPALVRAAEEAFGCSVFGGYGLSETSPIVTLSTTKDGLRAETDTAKIRRQAMTGMPLLDVDLKIVDRDGRELPWDGVSEGEIILRGNTVMKGYWRDADSTEAVMRDGWFHTGDIATVDPEGYVLIVDRAKDVIISGGENISSVELEKLFNEHPAVLECAVVGVPDETWGEVPLAIVVPKPGAAVTEADLLAFCQNRIAGYKRPKRVEFRSELPKGGTGKILKARLREPYWAGREGRV